MTTQSDRDGDSRLATATAKVSEVAGQAKETAGQVYGTAVERAADVLASAKGTAGDVYATARDKAGDVLATAKDGLATAKDSAGDALGTVRDKAGDAYAAARERAASAGKATSEGLQNNPFAALVGGLVAGVVAGALVPRFEREAAVLAPIGARLGDLAKLAAIAAKDAGFEKLSEAGYNSDALKTQVDKLLDGALGAARAAGGAAADAVRKPAQ